MIHLCRSFVQLHLSITSPSASCSFSLHCALELLPLSTFLFSFFFPFFPPAARYVYTEDWRSFSLFLYTGLTLVFVMRKEKSSSFKATSCRREKSTGENSSSFHQMSLSRLSVCRESAILGLFGDQWTQIHW